MIKYKDTYKVVKTKDQNGKFKNPDDTYIPSKNAQIYRFNADTLAIMFFTRQYAKNRVNDLNNVGVVLKLLQIGDDEQTYTFPESDFNIVAEICKARKKKVLSDETKEKLRNRLLAMHSKSAVN